MTTPLCHKGAYGSAHKASTNRTFAHGRCTIGACYEVTTWQENDAHSVIEADLAQCLLFQLFVFRFNRFRV